MKPAAADSSLTVRQWLRTQPYDVQIAEGIKILRELGIVK